LSKIPLIQAKASSIKEREGRAWLHKGTGAEK